MSEQKQTAAEIKEQIKKAQEELKNSSLPITGMLAGEVNANSTTDQAEVKPEPNKAAKGLEEPKTGEDPALKEWAKKKGIDWTTEESVLSALRKSDQAFHEKRQKEKQQEPANQPGYAQPAYVPRQPAYQPPPAPAPYYAPPVNDNRTMIENIARSYNVTAEDAEKLLPMMKDFYEAATVKDRQFFEQKFAVVERENRKNSVFRELASDPAFRNPEVAVEYHKTLEEMQSHDPRAFEEDPNQYMRAYDKTLANIARRNLTGRTLQEGVPPIATPPTNPPRRLNGASGGGSTENDSMTPQQFAKLPLHEKTAYLESIGLRPGN